MTRPFLRPSAIVLLLAVAAARVAPAADAPPVAPVEPVVETLHGVSVTDPYRWMEDRTAPRFVSWARAENDYARVVLARIPGRDDLRRRIAARTGGGTLVTRVQQAGPFVFFLKRAPDENTARLHVRRVATGEERLLVDPDAASDGTVHSAIDYYAPSNDGAHVAYGVSVGGSEASVMRVIDVATGKIGDETIDRTDQGSPSWLPDGRRFFYNRYVKTAPGAPETDRYQNSRVWLHRVGTDPESDVPVAGTGVPGSPPLTPVDTPFVAAQAGSPYAMLVVSHGADPAVDLYVADLASVVAGRPRWRTVATAADKVSDYALQGRRLFLLSANNAPRYKVLEVDAAAPRLDRATVAVPESERVIQRIAMSSRALIVQDLDDGLGAVRRLDLKTRRITAPSLPMSGSITELSTDPAQARVLIGMTGWVVPPRILRMEGDRVTDAGFVPPWREDLSAYVSEEVEATSHDGVRIPLSIVHRRDLVRDGSHPVWLTGYGAYGIPYSPRFVAQMLTLLDDGGVYAVAHVRGGGEKGEAWHQAGRLATKPNTHLDLIACAEYLTAHRYGTPATTAIEGRSAGGITVGMALTTRPELFRVAISGVGDSNTLRSEFGTDGPANALEYGSIATEEGFKALLAVDSTQHVKPGVDYPAVLLTGGMNDPRVAPWQPGKMAAHLQAANPAGRPVLFRVDFDAGHGIGSTKAQRDEEMADVLAFFYWQIGRPAHQPPH